MSIEKSKEMALQTENQELKSKVGDLEAQISSFDRKCRKLELRQLKQTKNKTAEDLPEQSPSADSLDQPLEKVKK